MALIYYSHLIALLLLLRTSVTSEYKSSYVAAVVEYHPVGDTPHENATFVLDANVANYEDFIRKAKSQEADIIVFPEYGLTGEDPSVSRKAIAEFAQTVPAIALPGESPQIPCLSPDASMAIKRLSCSARENQIYVVVNLPEIVPCNEDDTDCPEDGVYFYNTEVAFDRYGAVIAKYHKYHLYIEPAINTPPEPMYTTFTTDFGVKFGMFICFDIMYKEPAFNLAAVMDVKDIVYSSAWTSELPFTTAVQMQLSWSAALNVNLLASGYNLPFIGTGGSGIYLGTKGDYTAIMPSVSESKLLIAEVPLTSSIQHSHNVHDSERIFHTSSPSHSQHLMRPNHMAFIRESLAKFKYSDILKNGSNDMQLCDGNLCCSFHADVELNTDSNTAPIYRFLINNNTRQIALIYKQQIQVCALLHCTGLDVEQCSDYPYDPNTLDFVNFKSIQISGSFAAPLVLPSTLATNVLPLPPSSFNYVRKNDHITFSTSKSTQRLLAFGLYGYNFDYPLV